MYTRRHGSVDGVVGAQAALRVGLIRVITLPSRAATEAHGRWLMAHFPGLCAESRCIEGFPHGLYNDALLGDAVPAVIRCAEGLAPQVDALAVSCAEDPAVPELRSTFRMPVFGAGSSLGGLCRALSVPVGVLTITPKLPDPLRHHLDGVEYCWKQVPGVARTTDLPRSVSQIEQAARSLLAEGCQALALACTGFSSAGTRYVLEPVLDVPVLDPLVAMGANIVATLAWPAGLKEVIAEG